MKEKFYFSLLRYVYDPLTQEFVNIGVVLYSPAQSFLRATFTRRSRRISRMFGRVDGTSFRATTGYIERKVSDASERLARGLLFRDPKDGLQAILNEVVPADDSSIRFVLGGVGVTEDPAQTLEELFGRYVTRYEVLSENARREDNDVWKVFQEPLRSKEVFPYFSPKTITAPDYEYEFERSWKNGIWHLFEPVSFDLADASSISEKASKWVGRANSLSDSSERFKLFLLLGEPTDPSLWDAFQRATNLLAKKIPGEHKLIRERDAEQFAEEVEQEFQNHLLESQE
ncbi:MAG: DUF3037 domain-containing protein [Terracidiphilus sp.]